MDPDTPRRPPMRMAQRLAAGSPSVVSEAAASVAARRPPGRPPGSPGGPGRPHGNTRFKEEEQAIFLAEYARTHNMTHSALQAGVSWAAVNDLRKRSPEFAEAMASAEAQYRETLLAEAHRRAVLGVEVEKYDSKGNPIGTERKFSDTLLVLLLKRFYPGFRETDVRRIEGTVQHSHSAPALDVDAIRALPAARRDELRALLSRQDPVTIDADATPVAKSSSDDLAAASGPPQ